MPDPDPPARGANVPADRPATVRVFPPHYWLFPPLSLHFVGPGNFSLDETGARVGNGRANTPLRYVVELQEDLKTLGYYSGRANGLYLAEVKRAVTRFQRQAKRVFRMRGDVPSDVAPADVFTGATTGVCNHATAQEIRRWISAGHKIPVGRFKLVVFNAPNIGPGRPGRPAKVREDVAREWNRVIALVAAAGGTLGGSETFPYGDGKRMLIAASGPKKKHSSLFSWHSTGRAVDMNQSLATRSSRTQRFFLQKDPSGGKMFFRIFCKTDASHGKLMEKGSITCWDVGSKKENKDYKIPQGHYIDLTSIILSTGRFERIAAHDGWESVPNAREWWHYQLKAEVDLIKQKRITYQDEVELVGHTEAELRGLGWTPEQMDHAPG